MITGINAETVGPGLLGLLGPVTTYTGYGKGFTDGLEIIKMMMILKKLYKKNLLQTLN